MHHAPAEDLARPGDGYLISPGKAWFAFAMTIALMAFDYIDRQVIVSLFPHLKAEWGLSDKELGALVSIVSITVAAAGIPVALFADRVSRVKSIAAMATVWSLATISCMFTRSFGALLAARGLVGLGEAGYGSVGAGLLASHFPARMRGALMAGFFASSSVGSVLGVVLGGVIAARWGWQAAFGVVGVPGLVLALLYLFVRDYRTVELAPPVQQARRSTRAATGYIVRALARSHTTRWVCIGAAAQLIAVSALWSWLPSFLNRFQGMTPKDAAMKAAVVVLAGAAGCIVWGMAADRAGRRRGAAKLETVALLCIATLLTLGFAFGAPLMGIALAPQAQFELIVAGGFLMTCTVGPAAAIVIDVTHAGVRSTGASVLSLFQNLLGMAVGPFIAGSLSDSLGLQTALAITPLFSLVAAAAMGVASRSYESERASVHLEPAEPDPVGAEPAAA
ncbi:MAG: MFS transporter [Burkholderiales bacterium]|nr:MFS transporter [Burkholderiales bacterium]